MVAMRKGGGGRGEEIWSFLMPSLSSLVPRPTTDRVWTQSFCAAMKLRNENKVKYIIWMVLQSVLSKLAG